MEFKAGRDAIERITQGLKASQEGELLWLLGEDAQNPFEAAAPSEIFGHVNDLDVRNVKDTIITNHYIPREKAVEFLLEAFEELQKARLLLRWSYPYALFEFQEQFRRSSARPHADDFRVAYEAAQSALEMYAESLSDLIARKRVRGSKSLVVETVQSVRSKRSELENLIVQHTAAFNLEGDDPARVTARMTHNLSSSSSLTSSSRSERNSPRNHDARGGGGGFGGGDGVDMEAVLSKLGRQDSSKQQQQHYETGPVRSGSQHVVSSGYTGLSGGKLQRQHSDYPMDAESSSSMRDFKEDESDEDVEPYDDAPQPRVSDADAVADVDCLYDYLMAVCYSLCWHLVIRADSSMYLRSAPWAAM